MAHDFHTKRLPQDSTFSTLTLNSKITSRCHSRIDTNGASSTVKPPDSHVMRILAMNEGPISLHPMNIKVPTNHVSNNDLERPETNNLYG